LNGGSHTQALTCNGCAGRKALTKDRTDNLHGLRIDTIVYIQVLGV
jgi:hypothetical protein